MYLLNVAAFVPLLTFATDYSLSFSFDVISLIHVMGVQSAS